MATPSTVYVIGLTVDSKTLHVSSLSASTGELVASTNIPLSVAVGPSDVLALSSDTAPRLVWLDFIRIRAIALVPELKEEPTSVKGPAYTRIIDIGLQSKGYFVALTADGSGRILQLDADKLEDIWGFTDSVSTRIRNSSTASLMWWALVKIGSTYGFVLYWWT